VPSPFSGSQDFYIDEAELSPDLRIVGILPLVHLRHPLFGNNLVSLPFFDTGGILAENEAVERVLLSQAIQIGQKLKADKLELRHVEPMPWLAEGDEQLVQFERDAAIQIQRHKVRMILELPEKPEMLLNSFKAKLRNQIRKPIKEGLTAGIGGMDLLDDFYYVFSTHMRDLGSPVHSKKLIEHALAEFPGKAKLVIIYRSDAHPLACSLIIGFRDILQNPWSSALRKHRALSPNMLLYWTMIEFACNHNFRFFDFGRSSPGEGTYNFKKQWGAKPNALSWHYVGLKKGSLASEDISDRARFEKMIPYWQKLPVPVTKVLGPRIRKYIGL
jgi:FemAB-related protein (PEP-CTERM system-associated)